MHEAIERMLRALARDDVSEGALATGRFPSVRVADGFRGVAQLAVTTDDILGALMLLGGGARVDELSATPTTWSHERPGLGTLTISATMRGDDVRVRMRLDRDELQIAAGPAQPPLRPAAPLGKRPSLRPKAPSVAPPRRSSRAPKKNEVSDELATLLGAATIQRGDGSAKAAPVPVEAALNVDAYADVVRGMGDLRLPDAPALTIELDHGRGVPPREDTVPGLMRLARARNASDLHVIADRPPLFRVAGELTPDGAPIARDKVDAMLREIVPAGLAERFEREGSCDFALELPEHGRARVNVSRQRTGLKGCFRLIGRDTPSLESAGLPIDIARATHHHQGLIVVTGPTGHGKTTTLAAIVDVINSQLAHHVITVEDPVEYVHARKKSVMSQREVGTHTKTFHSALKGALREDPDVIVVGELRDLETVEMALEASETGHLVIGTMNTPSAAKTVDRLIDMFPPGDQAQVRMTLAGGLKLIVGQRLVPSADRKRMCAAVELLPGSVPLWNLIREQKTFQIPSLQQRGRALGILRLDDALADLVRAGTVRLDDVLPYAEAPEQLQAQLGGRAAPKPMAPGAPGASAGAAPQGMPAPQAPPASPAAGAQPGAKGFLDRAGGLFGRKGS
jgi:twitching motility protein PilT